MRRASGVLLAMAVLVAWCAPAVASTRPPKLAFLYGDSITYESKWALAPASGWTLQVGALGGLALCDFLDSLPQVIAEHPASIAFETVGNTARPCMADAGADTLGSDAYFAKIRSDIDAFFSEDAQAGVRTVFIEPPPMLDATWNAAVTKIISIATELAANYPNVVLSNRARNAVSRTGNYVAYKACLTTETAAMGCTSKKIAVRTIVGDQTGIHLCPDGLQSTIPPCDEYSSGEARFGRLEAKAATVRLQ